MYIIKINKKTYYRYGGNTRDKTRANTFQENEKQIIEKIMEKYPSSVLVSIQA